MEDQQLNQWLNLKTQDDFLELLEESFLIDRKVQNMARGTLYFYQEKLKLLNKFCDTQAIYRITQITPDIIRPYLLWLEEKGHYPGGVHGCYWVLKILMLWYEAEYEPVEWKNPIRKVKAPRLNVDPLEPIEISTIVKMLTTCKEDELCSARDKAIILALLDTGARATEFCSLNLQDYNQVSGEILIRQGKGRKPRSVFLGKKSRKTLRAYLRHRQDNSPALWITQAGERLTY